MLRRVLVTGFGFIGRHVVQRLVEEGCQVGVLVRRPDVAAPAAFGADAIEGDVRDAERLAAVVPEYDGVIHLAGLLGTSELIDRPAPAIETNIIGAVNVFQASRKRAVPVVHVSVANYFMDNTYAITKHTSERFAAMFNIEHGADIRVVRALNVYGEYQKQSPVRKILPTFIRAAFRGEPLRIYGSGEQIQDMIYAGDVARILVAALRAQRVEGVLSAGTGRRVSVNQIAQTVIETAASPSVVEHVPMRRGEPPGSVVLGDPSTLIPIGVEPASLVPIEEGIRRAIEWYRANSTYLD